MGDLDTPASVVSRMSIWEDEAEHVAQTFCPACNTWVEAHDTEHATVELPRRLWLYTNFHCNLACSYCVASSSPHAPRRILAPGILDGLLGEARDLGFAEVFVTGGEPFLLPTIFGLIAAAEPDFQTTILTNGLLLRGERLRRLLAVNHPNLRIQVSLDSSTPDLHDRCRGAGTWAQAVATIHRLQAAGLSVRIGSTIVPEGEAGVLILRGWVRETFGLQPEEHIVRPLVRRGVAAAGLDLGTEDVVPEITVSDAGVFWHPLGTEEDWHVSNDMLPLRLVLQEIAVRLARQSGGRPFR